MSSDIIVSNDTNGSELGRRIRAAAAYSSLGHGDELANRAGLEPATLRQIETGVVELDAGELSAVIGAVSEATGMPVAFFTADLQQLEPGWEPPESEVDRLEQMVRDLVERGREIFDRLESIKPGD